MERVIYAVASIMRLRPRAIEVLSLLAKEGELTVKEVAELLEISRRAAQDWLQSLLSKRLVRRKPVETDGRLSYVYYLPPPRELVQIAIETLKREIEALERLLNGR